MKAKAHKIYYYLFITIGIFLVQTVNLNAQVTIGTDIAPNQDALLDLKQNSSGTSTKGFLLPRVSLSSTTSPAPLSQMVEGMTVYNTATNADVVPGYYYNDGNKWIKLLSNDSEAMPHFFYMPSIVLPIDTSNPSYDSADNQFKIDLYALYIEQFKLNNQSSSTKSPGASSLPTVASSDLEYFITYYDNTVFKDVTVNNNGLLKYKLNPTITLSEKTFMNIVFKVK